MRSSEETGKDGNMNGTGIGTGIGGPDGMEGLKAGATKSGTEETKEAEAMKNGVEDTKNMADIEDIVGVTEDWVDPSRSTQSYLFSIPKF